MVIKYEFETKNDDYDTFEYEVDDFELQEALQIILLADFVRKNKVKSTKSVAKFIKYMFNDLFDNNELDGLQEIFEDDLYTYFYARAYDEFLDNKITEGEW